MQSATASSLSHSSLWIDTMQNACGTLQETADWKVNSLHTPDRDHYTTITWYRTTTHINSGIYDVRDTYRASFQYQPKGQRKMKQQTHHHDILHTAQTMRGLMLW
jgi:hypothetical protein